MSGFEAISCEYFSIDDEYTSRAVVGSAGEILSSKITLASINCGGGAFEKTPEGPTHSRNTLIIMVNEKWNIKKKEYYVLAP